MRAWTQDILKKPRASEMLLSGRILGMIAKIFMFDYLNELLN